MTAYAGRTPIPDTVYFDNFRSDRVPYGHQLTVDSCAVQHAGGPHPDKSADVHLAGFLLERGVRPTEVPARLQRLAGKVKAWPLFNPPAATPGMTIFDVAISART